jgi:hypothetical protein
MPAAISKPALSQLNSDSFPNNNLGQITPTSLRDFNSSMIASLVDEIPYGTYTASVNNSISALNTFTASGYPSYTALNTFSASQLLINTGVNSFTQSANSSITQLNTQTASFYAFTSSINQIQSNGVALGYSTRFNLVGSTTFFSASLTPNVNGAIATLTFTSDNGKTNTSSFNPFTASVNTFTASANVSITSLNAQTASMLAFTSSTNISIANLNQFTASDNTSQAALNSFTASQLILNSGFATTASFNSYTSSQSGLNSFTSSINTYTASNDAKWNKIGLLTGSYATTGSNVFTGSQTISGSVYGNINTLSITSNTASMDLSKGNFFTLTLVSGSTTELAASNIKAGQTINLLITQAAAGTGSLSYNSTFKFNPGNQYTASVSSSAKDILTFITFDNSTIYASAIKNLV